MMMQSLRYKSCIWESATLQPRLVVRSQQLISVIQHGAQQRYEHRGGPHGVTLAIIHTTKEEMSVHTQHVGSKSTKHHEIA